MRRGETGAGEESVELDPSVFLDADLAAQTDAARGGESPPAGIDALVERHLALIERWADQLG